MIPAISEPETTPAAAETTELALIDLSSIAHPIWHMSGAQPDPDYTSQQIVARVRALTANHPRAAICCDSGRSFRHDLSPDYKANRPQQEATLHHQIRLARERLQADGYPVWAVKGFEADDLIATAVTQALTMADVTVLIVSSDKDLLQLVGPRVRAMSANTGTVYDPETVSAKFGVRPDQIRDYLTLVGDSSDNVKGAAGIGPKKAAALLAEFESIEGIYRALDEHGTKFKPAMATALREFQPRLEGTRALVTLRTDAEIPFADVDNERQASDLTPMEETDMPTDIDAVQESSAAATAPARTEEAPQVPPPAGKPAPQPTQALTVREGDVLAPAPVEFERQLEPRSIGQAFNLAKAMYDARMFNGYGSAQAVLSTVLAGRELGMQAVASLRAFHVIEGKHALAADAMRGLVLRSGQAKYFRCVERTAERATFETHRHGEPEPVRLSYTIGEARAAYGFAAGLPDKDLTALEGKWLRSSWGKHPADMLSARASSKLARLVYSDILFGLYAPEELGD